MLETLQSYLSLSWMTYTLCAVVIMLSYCLLYAWGGMLSFGHAVYVGAGAYAAVYGLNQLELPVAMLPLFAGLLATLLALVLGFACTRKTGATFAMITLGVGELLRALSHSLPSIFGGEAGFSINRGSDFGAESHLLELCLLYTLLVIICVFAWTFSKDALYLQASKNNPERLSFLGISSTAVNYRSFCFAAFLAGIAGGMQALQFEHVNNSVFAAEKSGAYLVFAYLGLACSSWLFKNPAKKKAKLLLGALIAALCMSISQTWLLRVLPMSNLFLGLLFMLVVFVQSRVRSKHHA